MAQRKKPAEKIVQKAPTPEDEKIEAQGDVMTEVPTEEAIVAKIDKVTVDVSTWDPKTSLGKKVKKGDITSIDFVLDNNLPILEEQIVDALIPDLQSDLLLVGQSKGKFGGGQRRVFKQTQRKTCEGNKPSFATLAVVGNMNGYVGVGYGKSKETVPSREKSVRNAKLHIIKVTRGCGSWQCGCREPHTIPFNVTGKCGSTKLTLMPAPKGKGLVCDGEVARILRHAGIKDVWSKSFGQVRTKINLAEACIDALRRLSKTKLRNEYIEVTGVCEGPIRKKE